MDLGPGSVLDFVPLERLRVLGRLLDRALVRHSKMSQYLVLGGHLKSIDLALDPVTMTKQRPNVAFTDVTQVQFVGGFASWEKARDAWKAASWQNVDNAHMRFFIVPVVRLDQLS